MSYNLTMEPRRGFGIYDDRNCRKENLQLAIASVPMQAWKMTYAPEKALKAGTMFAELNLPFMGGGCR